MLCVFTDLTFWDNYIFDDYYDVSMCLGGKDNNNMMVFGVHGYRGVENFTTFMDMRLKMRWFLSLSIYDKHSAY